MIILQTIDLIKYISYIKYFHLNVDIYSYIVKYYHGVLRREALYPSRFARDFGPSMRYNGASCHLQIATRYGSLMILLHHQHRKEPRT